MKIFQRVFFISATVVILLTDILYAGTIHIVTENYPPLSYCEKEQVSGITTAIVKAVMEESGMSFDIEMLPWVRAYEMALNGKNVLIYSIAKSADRENKFKWIGPFFPYTESLYKLRERKDIVINSLDDAKKYKIGVIRGYAVHQELLRDGFQEGENLDLASHQSSNIKKLFSGRVDLIVGSAPDLIWRTRMQDDLPAFCEMEKALGLNNIVNDVYMAFGMNTPTETVEKIRAAYQRVKAKGTIDTLLLQYTGIKKN